MREPEDLGVLDQPGLPSEKWCVCRKNGVLRVPCSHSSNGVISVCVCVVGVCAACVLCVLHAHTRNLGVFYCSLPHCLEIASLTEPESLSVVKLIGQ